MLLLAWAQSAITYGLIALPKANQPREVNREAMCEK